MTSRAQEVLRDALSLPVAERADVAAELLASLDAGTEDPAEVEAAWAAEIERRARRVMSGESQGIPWEDVRARAKTELRIGTPVPRVPRNLPVRRLAVSRFPYSVVYLETPEVFRVLAVAHGRRKPEYWKKRLE